MLLTWLPHDAWCMMHNDIISRWLLDDENDLVMNNIKLSEKENKELSSLLHVDWFIQPKKSKSLKPNDKRS